ncbi:hypothetical protein Mal64_10170 [Pseudobythopirellula maris]|uniref:DUF6798 domain-containing protein n=1 Tax=Pseudobythopirellula maris TaxID=2527991 RepID=A0A5C5ZWI2_9BACT|nr:DUF6798 domain-containing protein [Pseudobythopirellula maris]TWT90623.1 hypothetical protein Mal64_10170 [Pseudobythopirellula maris]
MPLADEPVDAPAGPPTTGEAGARWRPWLETLLVLTVFFVASGNPAPAVNEAHYLTRLKHYWDPAWCAGDLFLESPEAHLTIVWLVGWATWFVSLETVAWLGRLVTWALLAWGWQRLSWRVLPRAWLSVLSAALLVVAVREGNFAGEWIVGGFEAKGPAWACVLFALERAIAGKWNLVWLLLGLATAMHALVGFWTTLVLLGVWAIYYRREQPLRGMLPGLVAGGVLGLAGVAPALMLTAGAEPAVVGEANQIYVFVRLPHHLAPLHKDADWIVNRGARHAVVLVVLALGWSGLDRKRPDSLRAPLLLGRVAWGGLAIAVTGLVIELLLWSQPELAAKLLRYYWFRLNDITAAIAASQLAAVWLAGAGARRSQSLHGLRAVATLGVMAICLWHFGPVLSQRLLEPPRPPADGVMRDPIAWIDACEWVAENTPEDTLWITPRRATTFKWRTGRPEVVNHKDIPQDAPSMVEWRRRLHNVFAIGQWPDGSTRWSRSVGQLGAMRLRELAEEYGAEFALSSNRYPASLPVLYRNRGYVVYDLR